MPPFKDEHILIIAPGSQLTMAQLGLPESFTPASVRLRTRMFPTEDGLWEPYKVRQIKKPHAPKNDADVEMGGTEGEGELKRDEVEDDVEYEEDVESDEGAVYPLIGGRITNMSAFLALLNHVHNVLSPTLHTPILLVAQPAWTAQDHEYMAQFFFEKFKTPAFCIMDSALAVSYAYGVQNATIVDVGYQKVDVSAVSDFTVQHVGRTVSLTNSGGDAMTERLLELLGPKGWSKDMCEQLKKSPFCEILPAGTPLPGSGDAPLPIPNPAAANANDPLSGPTVKVTEVARGLADADIGDDEVDIGEKAVDDEGVLDVASIVASGKTQEFLAAQEKKKAMAASRKAAKDARDAADAAAARPIRLPNSKREKITFHYQERKVPEEPVGVNGTEKKAVVEEPESKKEKTSEPVTAPEKTAAEVPTTEAAALVPSTDPTAAPPLDLPAGLPADHPAGPPADPSTKPPAALPTGPPSVDPISVEDQAAKREQIRAAKREEKRKAREGQADPSLIRREVEVGTERFMAASSGYLDAIADAVHRTVLSVDVSKRGDLWDSLIIVGNGCKVRGFKDALLSTLMTKYLISPSSATIFTSELPSNLSTPMGTGSQTPQREYPPGQHALPTGSSVNPLLLAATTASLPPNMNFGGASGGIGGVGVGLGGHGHSSHSQSPTSIKMAKIPEYFPEFKNDGFDESVFLGAQVAAKVLFVQDQGVSSGFLSRVQYNELGPSGIHEVGLAF